MTLIRGARLPQDEGPAVDLAVAGGTITAITPAGQGEADGEVIDAGGRLAMPGFIDAHAHAEAAVFDPDVQHAMLRQGVTSVVTGNDGVSLAPAPGATGQWATDYFAAINGPHPDGPQPSIAALRATYAGRTRINVAPLVPHGNLRHMVVGGQDRPATADELERMRDLLRTALAEGACGMSTGLEYQPGGYADAAELAVLGQVLAEHGLPHSSHMRGYEAEAPLAMGELARIATASGVATHISHLHGPAGELLEVLRLMRADGLDVTFDSYPYLRGASILSMVALPDWLPLADPDHTLGLLAQESTREKLLREHLPTKAEVWPRVRMAHVPGELSWTEGMTLPEVAERMGRTAEEAVLQLLVTTRLRAGCVFAQPPTNSAESVRALLREEGHIASSDAIYFGGRPHPRGWGAFARFLAECVRDRDDWTWAQAAWHLSGGAAQRFRLGDRGRLAPGMAADIALVDPQSVQDNATYEQPRRLATGIEDVLVGGRAVLRGGELTEHLTGTALAPTPVTGDDHA